MAGLGELDASGAFYKRRREWRVFGDVPEEQLPPGAITVAHRLDIRHLLPLLRRRPLTGRVPDQRTASGLRPAAARSSGAARIPPTLGSRRPGSARDRRA